MEDVQIFKKSDNEKKIIIKYTNEDREKYKDLEENELLNLAISKLPSNYNFEIYKSLIRINDINSQINRKVRVSLQMPDGFMIFSILIADILETFSNSECIILGDITYGACCIDDLGSKSLECDLIIHYGHSCLIPITETCVKVMYVFVDIQVDVAHLANTIEYNFNKEQTICLMGSIQYNNSVFLTKRELTAKGFINILIPQTKPRSNGEVLGCTSPNISSYGIASDVPVIFICDGRFHMESAMIANSDFTFYQYNPFTKLMTLEKYEVELMKTNRINLINKCKQAKKVGIIFGVLGRQGNPDILNNIIKILKVEYVIILLSEVTEEKLTRYDQCDCFIQIVCPRLSIDWSVYFSKPLITPYEAHVAFGNVEWRKDYPMDYYSYEGGEWSNYHNKKPKNYKK